MSANLVELLTKQNPDQPEDALYELCTTISNIVSSYDDPYDAFAELIQNALDAVAAKHDESAGGDFTPEVSVEVDIPGGSLTVRDNGTGIAWSQHTLAVKPNYSLKRRLGQRSSRGEKGAALAFLQFGHSEFSLRTRTLEEGAWLYSISDGREWFTKTHQILDDGRPYEDKANEFPEPSFVLTQLPDEKEMEVGTTAQVKFADNRLSELLGDIATVAKKRLEYILLTRTGVGFYVHNGDVDNLEPWQQKLKVSVTMTLNDAPQTWDVTPGFLFPHAMAKQAGARKSSLLTASKSNSELLYDYFDESWIKKYVERIAKSSAHAAVIRRFELRGYVSYAYQNSWYEEVTANHLQLSDDVDTSTLAESLIQVNGGFLLAVRDFPTGRRKSFLHRSGAEHKSRTFVLLNFSGDYKPDYGRKNLSAEAHSLVLDLCKALINFASEQREMLLRGVKQSAHSAKSTADAEEALKEDAQRLMAQRHLIKSGDSNPSREPSSETELIAEFYRIISDDTLPGFKVYGFLAKSILDGYFDYELPASNEYAFDSQDNPLGVSFAEGNPLRSTGQWLEFKVKSDALVDDVKKKAGEPGKKYFSHINLLVCQNVDTATDDFEVVSVDESNFDERRYYGVTHLLASAGNDEHKIQVICLKALKEILFNIGKLDKLPKTGTPLEV